MLAIYFHTDNKVKFPVAHRVLEKFSSVLPFGATTLVCGLVSINLSTVDTKIYYFQASCVFSGNAEGEYIQQSMHNPISWQQVIYYYHLLKKVTNHPVLGPPLMT